MFAKITSQALRAQISRRGQFFSGLGAKESLTRIPINAATANGASGITWARALTILAFLETCHQFFPFMISRHTRVTYKEARISEWYQVQYGDAIKKKDYKKWEEE